MFFASTIVCSMFPFSFSLRPPAKYSVTVSTFRRKPLFFLLEPPGNPDAANAQVGDIIEDGGRDIDGAATTARALINDLGCSGVTIALDSDPLAAVGAVAVLGWREGHDSVAIVVGPAASSETLYPSRG